MPWCKSRIILSICYAGALCTPAAGQDHRVHVVGGELFGRVGQDAVWVVTADPLWFELLVAYDTLQDAQRDGAVAIIQDYQVDQPASRTSRWLRTTPLSPADLDHADRVWAGLPVTRRQAVGTWLAAQAALIGASTPDDMGLLAGRLAARQTPLTTPSLLPRPADWLVHWLAAENRNDASNWRPTRSSVRRLLREVSEQLAASGPAQANDARAALSHGWLVCTRATLARQDSLLTDIRLTNALAHLVLLRGNTERRLEGRLGRSTLLSNRWEPDQAIQFDCTAAELDALDAASSRIAACLPRVHGAAAALGLPHHAELGTALAKAQAHLTALRKLSERCGLAAEPVSFAHTDPLVVALANWSLPPLAFGPRMGFDDEGLLAHSLAIDPDAPGVRNPLGQKFWQLGCPGFTRPDSNARVYAHEVGVFLGKAVLCNEPGFVDQ